MSGEGWEHGSKGLWKDDVPQGLAVCESDCRSGFELRRSDGVHGCAQDFGDIGAREEGKGNHPRPEAVFDADGVGNNIEQDVDLREERGSSDEGDIAFAEVLNGQDAGGGA